MNDGIDSVAFLHINKILITHENHLEHLLFLKRLYIEVVYICVCKMLQAGAKNIATIISFTLRPSWLL